MNEHTASRAAIAADVTREIAKNLAMASPKVREQRLRRPRTAVVSSPDTDALLDRYAFDATRALLTQVGSLEGKHILEIGPGDNFVSGLAFMAAGAASYTGMDRFVADYSGRLAKSWYRAAQDAWPRLMPDYPWPPWLQAERFPEAYGDRVESLREGVERAAGGRSFDIVCSFQVAEHVTDVRRLAQQTKDLLAPEGLALHRVDFGPHDCWRRYADPVLFLRFPSWLWRAMGSNRGIPNRVRHHQMLRAFSETGLQVQIQAVGRFPTHGLDYDRLSSEFRAMPRWSLEVADALYACRHADAPRSA